MMSPESYKIPFFINFLDKNGMLNWTLLERYIDNTIFAGINENDCELMKSAVTITVKYQMIESTWIRNRVLLSDKNIPLGLELENTVNLLQMPTYPIFDELDSSKFITEISPQFSHNFTIAPKCSKFQHKFHSPHFHIPTSARGMIYSAYD